MSKENKKNEPLMPDLHLFDNGQGDYLLCPNCRKYLGHPMTARKIKKCPDCEQKLKELKW